MILSSLIIFRLLRDCLCFLSYLFSYISQVQPRDKKYQEYFSLESLSNLYKITDSHILQVNNLVTYRRNLNCFNWCELKRCSPPFLRYQKSSRNLLTSWFPHGLRNLIFPMIHGFYVKLRERFERRVELGGNLMRSTRIHRGEADVALSTPIQNMLFTSAFFKTIRSILSL